MVLTDSTCCSLEPGKEGGDRGRVRGRLERGKNGGAYTQNWLGDAVLECVTEREGEDGEERERWECVYANR